MATDLIGLVKGYLTPDVMQRAASYVGESPAATQKAIGGVVPTIVAALSNLASTSGGPQQIVRTLEAGKYDGSALSNLEGYFAGSGTTQSALAAGREILNTLFGGKLSGVTDLIAQFAGVRTGSASSLLGLAAPITLHILGRQRSSMGLSASGIASLLEEQKGFLGDLLPAGLSSLLGWPGIPAGIPSPGVSAAPPMREAVREPARAGWVLPAIVLGALALGALGYLLNWWGTPSTAVREGQQGLTELQLPGGLKVSVPEGSFNFSLAQWLADTRDTAVPRQFIFDNLNFDTGTTNLTPDSRPTIDSLVAIMQAYPTVEVRLEGHTDSTGDPTANKQLSLDRANAVKALMVSGGIAAARIATDGFGQEKPLASSDTEEGRAKNRRLELMVMKR